MSPPPSPAPNYRPEKTYTPRRTTSTSPPPIPARSPARVPAPAPTFCPIVETPALPPKATKPPPLIPTLPPPAQQFDQKAWADEDYPELIDGYDYPAHQVQQAGPRRYFSFSNTPSLRTIPEENQESISAFADAPSTPRPVKLSVRMPTSPFVERNEGETEVPEDKGLTQKGVEEAKEGSKEVKKDQGEVKKENLPFRGAKPAKEDEEDEEKRFV